MAASFDAGPVSTGHPTGVVRHECGSETGVRLGVQNVLLHEDALAQCSLVAAKRPVDSEAREDLALVSVVFVAIASFLVGHLLRGDLCLCNGMALLCCVLGSPQPRGICSLLLHSS